MMRDDTPSYEQVGAFDDADDGGESDTSCHDEARANANAEPQPTVTNGCSLLRIGGALSVLAGAVCLASVYQHDERFQFVRQRYHAGVNADATANSNDNVQPPSARLHHHGQDQHWRQHADGEGGGGGKIPADLAYKTAPFDIPYTKIECQPCSKASHLMNPLAPYAIIGGAMKGGTRALLTYQIGRASCRER